MERDGLIQRTPDPVDGRSSLISLTQTAETRMPGAIETVLQGNREALRGFTDKEAVQLIALLKRVIVNLDRIASAEASPPVPRDS